MLNWIIEGYLVGWLVGWLVDWFYGMSTYVGLVNSTFFQAIIWSYSCSEKHSMIIRWSVKGHDGNKGQTHSITLNSHFI